MSRLLRDAEMLPIWEGTTNVLSLDVLRVLAREEEGFAQLRADLERRLDAAQGDGALRALEKRHEPGNTPRDS